MFHKKKYLFLILLLNTLSACGDKSNPNSSVNAITLQVSASATDITNRAFTVRSATCADYAKDYKSDVTDITNDKSFMGNVIITVVDDQCSVTSNSIPNHDFNDLMAQFAHNVAAINKTFFVTMSPTKAKSPTALSLEYDNAIFLNGVKLDLLAAACYGVGNDRLGSEKIGCNDSDQPFRYDPMSSFNSFGTDTHNAHTQPNGTYHYHGDPVAMYDDSATTESAVIGFAADGFPIYGPYIKDMTTATIRKVTSSYQLKSGKRQSQTYKNTTYNPVDTFNEDYNGRFVDDWEYVNGSGDLDECNGMTYNGAYGYYVVDAYPWVLKCFKGTINTSFSKRP